MQTQSAPNNFDHAGESGDCGVATATGSAGAYKFKLAHKAAYLCFQPRCMNTNLGPNIRLTKVVVTSTSGDIAGTYDFSTGALGTLVSGGGNSITLNTANFPIDNTSADVQKNGAYMVIAPGNHTVNIDYYIKDPTTNVEGAVHKTGITLNCAEGTISDVTAWVDKDITEYANNHYYQWDAQQNLWHNMEWGKPNAHQPSLNGATEHAYFPVHFDDPRIFNHYFISPGTPTPAVTPFFKSLPNCNEVTWYVMKGDAHYDDDRLWTTMGHLYKGGMWFKKIAKIAEDEGVTLEHIKEKGFYHVDFRPYGSPISGFNYTPSNTPLTPAEQADYFYLPMLGRYDMVNINSYTLCNNIGSYGAYWSSYACPFTDKEYTSGSYYMRYRERIAWSLEFSTNNIIMNSAPRSSAFPAIPFRTASSTGTGPFFE